MRLPFVHSTTSGLYITDTGVVWVSGTRLGSRWRRVEQAYEAVEDGDLEAALVRLVEHLAPSIQYVISHLDPLHVRHVMVQGPALDDADSFEAWLEAEAQRHLPPRATLSNFAIRVQVLEQAEAYTRCLLVLASREAVEARVALLEAAGLRPLGIRSIDVASGEALRLHGAFAEGRSALLFLRPEDATLLHYREGVLQSLETLPFGVGGMDVLSLLQAVSAYLAPMPDRLFVMGTTSAEVIAQAREADLFECAMLEGTLDLSPYMKAPPLGSDHIPAAALVLPGHVAASEAINFLEPDAASERLQALEKREAMRALLLLGGFVALVYLLQALATVYLGGKQAAAEVALSQLADHVARIEQVHEAVQRLERDVAQAEQLVHERTHVAGILTGMGAGAPEGLWLETVDLEAATDRARLTLLGMAYREGNVARYLERLEQAPFATNVRLLYAEAVRAATLYKHAGVQDRPLTRFEIQLTCTSLDPSAAGTK